ANLKGLRLYQQLFGDKHKYLLKHPYHSWTCDGSGNLVLSQEPGTYTRNLPVISNLKGIAHVVKSRRKN
ncbi:MAG TPA: hypothetical protein VN711_00600, partial [Candidatus Saccharimonadales bacterium]|nr:hypothetical protein [Candidatus Saccharimonadales bacterium]